MSPLRGGEEYAVLEMYAKFGGRNYYRIDPMDGSAPALFDTRGFSVISPSVSRLWVAGSSDEGSLFLRPEEWAAPGFWEAYFDGEDWAEEGYVSLRDALVNEAAPNPNS
ncbi:hypothetical protein [Streptomyces albireticuli]|nr:hypothetical protein [Streptomyces albireticuli]MCD9141798.1 hypothetical protein [Streptomyces albireticuli]MCD9163258.1 hypothetical protein [Streptomyces albireticuli]MCD9189972.1 hypothetical protein [Streptomyces albireticuli]